MKSLRVKFVQDININLGEEVSIFTPHYIKFYYTY